MLDRASRFLDRKLSAMESETVRVRLGAASVRVSAVIGRSEIGSGSGGAKPTWNAVDFLIAQADLILGGHVVQPTPGMKIERTVDGRTVTYQVLNDDSGRFPETG